MDERKREEALNILKKLFTEEEARKILDYAESPPAYKPITNADIYYKLLDLKLEVSLLRQEVQRLTGVV